jgi:hypothetical protein
VRVIPEALVEKYALTFGKRNQIESFFSWLEKRFYVKDRHASWGREAQLLAAVAICSSSATTTDALQVLWAHTNLVGDASQLVLSGSPRATDADEARIDARVVALDP